MGSRAARGKPAQAARRRGGAAPLARARGHLLAHQAAWASKAALGARSHARYSRGEGKAAVGRAPRASQGHPVGSTPPEAWGQAADATAHSSAACSKLVHCSCTASAAASGRPPPTCSTPDVASCRGHRSGGAAAAAAAAAAATSGAAPVQQHSQHQCFAHDGSSRDRTVVLRVHAAQHGAGLSRQLHQQRRHQQRRASLANAQHDVDTWIVYSPLYAIL